MENAEKSRAKDQAGYRTDVRRMETFGVQVQTNAPANVKIVIFEYHTFHWTQYRAYIFH